MKGKSEKINETIIQPGSKWFGLDFRELWFYRDLVKILIYRDIVVYYKQTILGPLWFVIQPLFSTFVFTLVFSGFAGLSTEGLPAPIFYLSGIIIWNYFSESLNMISESFWRNYRVFDKVYFPRFIIPVSIALSNLIRFLLQLLIFIVVIWYYAYHKSITVNLGTPLLLLPLLVLQMVTLAVGFGSAVAALTTKYRDLKMAILFFVQLWMYVTPIVYPIDKVPTKYLLVYSFNPVVSVVELFRKSFFGVSALQLWQIELSIAVTLVIFLIGITLFSRAEKNFMDVI